MSFNGICDNEDRREKIVTETSLCATLITIAIFVYEKHSDLNMRKLKGAAELGVTVTVDSRLNVQSTEVLFPEQLRRANEALSKIPKAQLEAVRQRQPLP